MLTKTDDSKHLDQKNQERQQRDALIERNVIRGLGQPRDLHKVQVRQVWQDHYRVNVLIGTDAACVRVAHSYFLVADGDGNIVAATPEIAKQY